MTTELKAFAALLEPSAPLEAMAQRAHELTLRHFGRTIRLLSTDASLRSQR